MPHKQRRRYRERRGGIAPIKIAVGRENRFHPSDAKTTKIYAFACKISKKNSKPPHWGGHTLLILSPADPFPGPRRSVATLRALLGPLALHFSLPNKNWIDITILKHLPRIRILKLQHLTSSFRLIPTVELFTH